MGDRRSADRRIFSVTGGGRSLSAALRRPG